MKGHGRFRVRVMQGKITRDAEVGWTLVWAQSIKGLVWQVRSLDFVLQPAEN